MSSLNACVHRRNSAKLRPKETELINVNSARFTEIFIHRKET